MSFRERLAAAAAEKARAKAVSAASKAGADTSKPSSLAARMSARRQGPPPPNPTRQIVGLPRVFYRDFDLTPAFQKPGGTVRLFPIQSAALIAIRHKGGGLFPIGVGHGKTFISALAGDVFNLPPEAFPPELGIGECEPVERVVIFTKAGAVTQTRREVARLHQHMKMNCEVKVYSYHAMSRPKNTEAMSEWIGDNPRRVVLVLDEAHCVKDPKAARTKRFYRAIESHPGLRVVALSGTLVSRKLVNAAKIASVALGESSPIPKGGFHLQAWSDWIDVQGFTNAQSWKLVRILADEFGPPESEQPDPVIRAREAFQARLRSCPGVVASKAGALDVSLQIQTLNKPRPPREITEMIAKVKQEGELPDGEVIEDDLTEARVVRQLSAGFWYRWAWGEEGPDLEWMDARSEWARQVRGQLRYHSGPHYDSPALVEERVRMWLAQGRRLGDLGLAWKEWEVQKARRPKPPPTETVWVSDYLVKNASEWLTRSGKASLLWYQTRAVAEKLASFGVEVIPAGSPVPADTDRPLALSIRSHGTGLNLQAWNNQLVIEPPSSGEVWEQLLGRTHRPGQQSDEVRVSVYTNTDPLRGAWRFALDDAAMTQQATGNQQKLVIADKTA